MTKKIKLLFVVSLSLLLMTMLTGIFVSRLIRVDCVYCGGNYMMISLLEDHFGYFDDIPIVHFECEKEVAKLANEEQITVGQWLEERGYRPRPEEIEGKTWKEIINRETKLEDFIKK